MLRRDLGATDEEIATIDARVQAEIDQATDEAEASPPPEPLDALVGVYADPPVTPPLWFRAEAADDRYGTERAEGWGTWPADGGRR